MSQIVLRSLMTVSLPRQLKVVIGNLYISEFVEHKSGGGKLAIISNDRSGGWFTNES